MLKKLFDNVEQNIEECPIKCWKMLDKILNIELQLLSYLKLKLNNIFGTSIGTAQKVIFSKKST